MLLSMGNCGSSTVYHHLTRKTIVFSLTYKPFRASVVENNYKCLNLNLSALKQREMGMTRLLYTACSCRVEVHK